MPSMPAASNGGEDRLAHTGSAVIRPVASASGTRSAGSLAEQPPASRAARQASRTRAAGTSRRNGLPVMITSVPDDGLLAWFQAHSHLARAAIQTGPRALDQPYSVTSTSAPAPRPVASSGTTTNPSAAVSTDSSADSPNSGTARPSSSRT